jgi:hypothetical protein
VENSGFGRQYQTVQSVEVYGNGLEHFHSEAGVSPLVDRASGGWAVFGAFQDVMVSWSRRAEWTVDCCAGISPRRWGQVQ